MKQLGIRISLILLIAIFVAAGWYFVSPLFLNRVVDEASPFVFPSKEEVGMIMPPNRTIAEEVAARLLAPDQEATGTSTAAAIMSAIEEEQAAEEQVEEKQAVETIVPATAPIILSQGHFVDGDAFHKGSGIATLFTASDGSYLLRFEEFTATNGPDLHVLLSPNATPTNHATLGEYLDLGTLKGNIGDQNYILPADFDPTQYKSVVIYCLPFQVIFATATLETR